MKTLKKLFSILAVMALAFAIGIVYETQDHFAAITLTILAGSFLVRKGMAYQSNIAFAILDPNDLTWNGKEAMDLSEAIYKKVFITPGLSSIHQMMTGIKAKTQLPFLGSLGLVGKKKTACDTTPNPGGISMSEKFADPEWITDRFEECWDTLAPSFFVWGLKEGIKKEDLTDTDFANFLEDKIAEAMMKAIFRIAHMGKVTEDTIANGGQLVNGTDKDYFNIIDGMWTQAISIATADTNRRVTITKNAAATFALQKFDAADVTNKVAETLFQDLYYNADFRVRGLEGLMILCTQSVADQYAKELRSRNLDASYTRIEGGYKALMFEGIPIVPISYWDVLISTYYHNGTKAYLPHRAILVSKENIPLITENESSLSELKAGYYDYGKKYYVDFGFLLDMKILDDELVQVGY